MKHPVVARIYAGYTVTATETGEKFRVMSSAKMRGKQYYRVRSVSDGQLSSLDRDNLLALQSEGKLVVTLE